MEAPKLAWGHINLNVTDLERSIEFYEKLGFEMFIPAIPYLGWTTDAEAAAVPDGAARALGIAAGTGGRACILQLEGGFPKLDLTELESPTPSKPLANADLGFVRICLASQDLQSDYARLNEQGVAFLSEPQPAKDGLADIAICVDPDGALVELIQIHPDRWPRPPSTD